MTTSNPTGTTISLPFRPTARLLQLLGDELIATPRLAVFELVKNAYDADATNATVRLNTHGRDISSITVSDDGEGMTLETLQSVWLVPGHSHRRQQRQDLRRTPLHGRLPTGEKGLGRFAAHKLGNRITVVTRAKRSEECVININWNELSDHQYLEDALVSIATRPPQTIGKDATGTIIQISELRSTWTRGEVRRLHNQITSMCSPFRKEGDFQAILQVPGNESWIHDLPDVSEILERAFWTFSFHLQGGFFDWEYEFRHLPGFNLSPRHVQDNAGRLQLPRFTPSRSPNSRVTADATTTEGIGSVQGVFYAYDRDRQILRNLPDQQAVTRYLDESGGIRVYRDGIRVYNYGEQGDDWLGLDLRRVNSPSHRISRNIIVGAVHLSLAESVSLIEKTNREGFVENDTYQQLRCIILGAIGKFESERSIDKARIRPPSLGRRPDDPAIEDFESLMANLRRALNKAQANSSEIAVCLHNIERHYQEMEEALVSAGMAGLNLAIIFHETERGIKALQQAVATGKDIAEIGQQVSSLAMALEGFSLLLRRNSQNTFSARRLISQALRLSDLRLKFHRVQLVCPLLDGNEDGFHATFAFNLVLGAISNLIDNALYWLQVRWPDLPPEGSPPERMLYVGISHNTTLGPSIVVADNGHGFQGVNPEYLTRPFFTRKPEGMGLGLYYSHLAMKLQGGQLHFPPRGSIELPANFDGAAVSLVFKEAK